MLPGTPRDLQTIEAHLERMEAWAVELWKANNIDIHWCDGTASEGMHGLLDNIRKDAGAITSCVRDLQKSQPLDMERNQDGQHSKTSKL
ncbi:MAG: hypothetical protein OER56_02990 [Hyphomicrobiales bacterium]|nr:hypothetical protein [Hyphomicrobiales bacterium]